MTKIKSVIVLALAGIITTGVSCVKKDPLMRMTQILMVPLSPDAANVDFSLNDNLVATSVGYSTTVGTVTYTLPYYTLTPGSTEVAYNVSGTATPYASITTPANDDIAYSSFLIDSISRAKVAFVVDDVSAPKAGKVKLRFFNFSPNAGPLDVVKVNGAKLFAKRTFNDQTNEANQKFIEVDPGIYQFAFRKADSATALYTTSNLNLLPDRIYTLAARGVTNGATNKALGAWFYANKP